MSEARLNLITVGLGEYDVSGCGVLFGIFYVDPVLGVFAYALLASSLLVSIQTG